MFHVSAFFSSADYLIFDDLMGINAAGNNPPSVKIKVGTGVLLYHQTKQKERHFFFIFRISCQIEFHFNAYIKNPYSPNSFHEKKSPNQS